MSNVCTCLRLVGLGVLSLLLLALPHPVLAQPSDDGSEVAAPSTGPATANEAMATLGGGASTVASEVQIAVRNFGVGNRARRGGWIGIEVELTDSADKPRNVLIRISSVDIDYDEMWMQRTVVTNPGARQLVWLYMRLPFGAKFGTDFPISAHEAVEIAGDGQLLPNGQPAPAQYRAGRLLGSLRFRPQVDTVDSTTSLIAVVGPRGGGLEQFNRSSPVQGIRTVTGHEIVEVVGGLTPAGMPDRWMGLEQFEALGWTGTASVDQPSQLREAQAEAIREWVRRGGHLCIVLPPVAQPWINAPTNPLLDIMPQVRVNRLEGVDLGQFRSLLTTKTDVALPNDAVVQTFTPDNAGPYEAMPIMVGPNNECVVVRRLVGSGAVTVVGIDLTSRKLSDVENGLRADQFWNRVLGKRAPLLSSSDWQDLTKDRKTMPYGNPSRAVIVDAPISGGIASQAKAATGVLLAFVVFLAYWLLAGPLGYVLLKGRGMKQHAWLAFVAAAGLFTVIAWGGASMLKIRSVQGRHLTFVDSVYGQSSSKVRSWVSVFLPRYGEQTLSVAPVSMSGAETRNLIAPWDQMDSQAGSAIVAFTDSRGYTAEARSPDTISVPARATTKQVQVDWAGPLPSEWGMIRPLADASVPVGQEIRVGVRDDAKSAERKWTLEGTLVHTFPVPLKNVELWFVEGQRPTRPGNNAPKMFSEVRAAKLPVKEWGPNVALVLDTQFKTDFSKDRVDDALGRVTSGGGMPGVGMGVGDSGVSDENFGVGVTFFSMTPPQQAGESWAQVRREATHGLDLSRWFTQPSLIVIGELEEAESPIPIRVDNLSGEDARKRIKGRTIVRWVYPLAPKPAKAETLTTLPSAASDLDELKPTTEKPE